MRKAVTCVFLKAKSRIRTNAEKSITKTVKIWHKRGPELTTHPPGPSAASRAGVARKTCGSGERFWPDICGIPWVAGRGPQELALTPFRPRSPPAALRAPDRRRRRMRNPTHGILEISGQNYPAN